jgi:hypothetical protein
LIQQEMMFAGRAPTRSLAIWEMNDTQIIGAPGAVWHVIG